MTVWLYRLGALAITLIVSAYAIEWGADELLRARYCDSASAAAAVQHSSIASVSWEPRPNHNHRNNLGLLRSEDVRVSEKTDGLRIVVVGDSVMATQDGDSVADLLEIELRSQFGPKLEVWNYSLSGWSLHQEVAIIEERVLDWHPDLIVVAYTYNDPVETPVMSCTNQTTSTGTAIEALLVGARLEFSIPPERAWYDPNEPYLSEVRQDFHKLAAAVAATSDVPVLVAIIPILVPTDADQPHVLPTVLAATDAGLEVADLSKLARSTDLSAMRMAAYDKIHFNHDGRVLLARELAPHAARLLTPTGGSG